MRSKIRSWAQIIVGLLFVSSPVSSQRIDILSESMHHSGYGAVAVSGVYTFCSADWHLLSISFADSASPQVTAIDYLPAAAAAVLQGNYIYLSGSMFQGDMSIVDISNPSNPQSISTLTVDDRGSTDIFVEGDYAYVTCYNDQVAIVNISNGLNPFIENRITTGQSTYGIAKLGNYLYVAEYDSGLVVNVADPANPFICGSINPHLYPWNAFCDVVASGNYCYLSSTEHGLFIFDISNPASPVFLSSIWPDSNRITTIGINGNEIYAVSPYRGLYTIDVSNPLAPVVLNLFCQENAIFEDIAISGSHLYLSGGLYPGNHYYSIYGFVAMLDISQPSQPLVISMQRGSPVAPKEVALFGNYAIVGRNGAFILDISDPADPRKIGKFSSYIGKLKVVDNIAYALSNSSRLLTIDLSNLVSPSVMGQITVPGFPNSLAIGVNYAYVSRGGVGFYIIDISDPYSPEIVRFFDDGSAAGGLIYDDNYLYTLSGNLGIFDVSDPENPLRLCNYQPPYYGVGFCVAGDYAFILGRYRPPIELFRGFMIIDISDKSNPALISSFNTEEVPKRIDVDGDYAFILDRHSSIEAVDISNPEFPVSVARQDSITGGSSLIVRDSKIYLGGVTFMIMQFNNPTLIEEHTAVTSHLSDLKCFPNPSNSSFSINFNQADAGNVEIKIYDIQGRLVETILDRFSLAGNHSVMWKPANAASGIYFARLESGNQSSYMKLILLK